MAADVLTIYIELARKVVNQEIGPHDFMMSILSEYKDEKRFFDEVTRSALDALFYAAEDYVDEPSLRPGTIGDAELLEAARNFLSFAEAKNDSGGG